MKIMIDATPQELAEFIFELVDCDVEIEDVDCDVPIDGDKRTKLEVATAVIDALNAIVNKPTT